MDKVNILIQTAAGTLLLLVSIFFLIHSRKVKNVWTGIAFTLCVFCYVIVESNVVQSILGLQIIVIAGAISIPFFFWLLSQAIFDDHFSFKMSMLFWLGILLIVHFTNFFMTGNISWQAFDPLIAVLAQLVSLSFVIVGLYTVLKTRQNDLIEARIRFRNIFLTMTAALIGITAVFELIKIDNDSTIVLQILQRSTIIGISLYFLSANLVFRPGFFLKEISVSKSSPVDDPQLNPKLLALMEEQRVYRKEGLTIGQLAEMMQEQEYKLRRLINGQLGFRNFNDFLNQYRVNEACKILIDPNETKRTILEIAYDLGYQSIGPFNKAFRELKGTTPTAYRKSQKN